MLPWYTTREAVASAPDVKASAHQAQTIDADIEAASRSVEHLLHRYLYPWTGVRHFNFPARPQRSPSWKIYLNEFQLISLTSVTNGDGSVIPASDCVLRPESGPPYDVLELKLSSQSGFSSGQTWQNALSVAGLWGDSYNLKSSGTVVGAVNNSQTSVTVSNSAQVGVGSLVVLGAERLQVTEKDYVATGATVHGALTAKANDSSFTVDSGTVSRGEQVIVDGEMLDVLTVTGTTVTVRRAASGSTLATHNAGVAIYAPRVLTVERGATGTTAATASNGDTVWVWQPEGTIRQLTEAIAVAQAQQRSGGWTKGKADALDAFIDRVRETYGRYRTAAV